ncbi:hypothetical protein GB931_02820 [Modestobacter sp. I12A-02628]|uniref:HEAT repeat domain-containing protein n=1 Tax=Goekera deserti TaxID=2497753 RepID=A0A7K3WDA9_9ACTN|nr:HEAT repeat domain-containing protein [Goekera deserti]MPQ96870.1 hypothetical protein [Goekera deserti]NDI46816.1 hypothetical protein [Goekera deserti]NEL54384.1 HEAT repeat domain-containing protein [Goekera deserti]
MCFVSTDTAAECAVALLRHYNTARFIEEELPVMQPRIALHVGEVFRGLPPDGPAFNVLSAIEREVNPGSIWMTEEFAQIWKTQRPSSSRHGSTYIGRLRSDKLGQWPIYELVVGKPSLAAIPSARVDPVELALAQLRESEDNRTQAVDALGSLRDARSRTALLNIASAPDQPFGVRARALQSLRRQAEPYAARHLIDRFTAFKDFATLRRLAVEAVGHVKDGGNVKFLIGIITDIEEHLEVREAALLGLHRCPVGNSKSSLTGVLGAMIAAPSQDPQLLQAAAVAATALMPIEQELREALARIVSNPERPAITREACLESLVPLLEGEHRLIGIAASLDEPEALRRIVLQDLADSGRGKSLDVLKEVAANYLDPLRSFALLLLSDALAALPTPRPVESVQQSAHLRIIQDRTGWRSA